MKSLRARHRIQKALLYKKKITLTIYGWLGDPVTGHNVVNTKKWVRSTIYSHREYNTFMLITLKGYVIMGPFISSKTFNNSSTLSYMYM